MICATCGTPSNWLKYHTAISDSLVWRIGAVSERSCKSSQWSIPESCLRPVFCGTCSPIFYSTFYFITVPRLQPSRAATSFGVLWCIFQLIFDTVQSPASPVPDLYSFHFYCASCLWLAFNKNTKSEKIHGKTERLFVNLFVHSFTEQYQPD